MKKVIVCPVAYNEHVKIKSVIERFLRSPLYGQVDYLVVDDGSTDQTTAIIESFSPQGVKTLRHPQRQGVGATIRSALKYAKATGYEVIVIMAGNDKDNPNEIPQLIAPILEGETDLVQGSRYLQGGKVGGDMPFYRKFATRLHPFLFSCLVRREITDSTNGFRAIRLSLLDDARINLEQEWLHQYELEPYLLFKSITLGYRYQEVPVTKIYPPKKLGYTKMQPIVGWWSILRPLIYLGLGIKK
ncbi:MAG: glycosyltransferase family 2 protein [Candidatus Omnitrophica bacterium]|nr:glycosyltransferase family 2 protein [Candidatus Omnitrophota bacterium]